MNSNILENFLRSNNNVVLCSGMVFLVCCYCNTLTKLLSISTEQVKEDSIFTDIRGKTVYSTILERGQGSADIDLSAMSKGYYVIILEGGTGTISRNIIVE